MPYRRPNRPRPWWLLFFVVLLLALPFKFADLFISFAQEPGAQHQRPRRAPVQANSNRPAANEPATTRPSGTAQTGPIDVDEDDVLTVDTQLVPVPVVVRDRAGRPVANLRAENFVLYEDGQPQRISNFSTSDAPFEVALLLDTSGSTRADLGLIRRAANLFIEQLRKGDRVAVVSFRTVEEGGEKRAEVEVNSSLTDDRDQLEEAIEKIGTSNGTPLYDALERVVKEVFREPPREGAEGRRALVALTDGVDSTSIAEFEEARARLRQSGVFGYFIQVNTEEYVEDRLLRHCQERGQLGLSKVQLERYRRIFAKQADAADFSNFCQMGPFERMHISRALYQLARTEMQELARDTGGRTFPATDLRDARRAFAQVAEEIGKLYSLGYYPTNKARDGRFRAIRVEVKGIPGAQVTAREGYQAPKS
jgi:Ca-activated chloride channel family protein